MLEGLRRTSLRRLGFSGLAILPRWAAVSSLWLPWGAPASRGVGMRLTTVEQGAAWRWDALLCSRACRAEDIIVVTA